jgi:hypothetical protein
MTPEGRTRLHGRNHLKKLSRPERETRFLGPRLLWCMKNKLLVPSSFFYLGAMLIATSAYSFPHTGGGFAANATTVRTGTYQSLHNGSGTFTQTVTRAPGSKTGTTTWTNAKGQTGDHTFDDTWNKSTGTGTVSASTTYANGKTSSTQGDWTKTGQGDASYTGTHTNTSGQVTDVSKSVTDVNGVKTIDSTYTNTATGKTTTVDRSITNANGVKQVDTTKTNPNGTTRVSDQTYTKTGNGYDQTGTVTHANGKVTTDNKDVNVTTDANGDITRTMTGSITGPNGGTRLIGNSETYSQTVTPNSH